MVFMLCESCGSVGVRIGTSGRAPTLHPAYSAPRRYHCSICGDRLRVISMREYNSRIDRGADRGA